MKKDYFVIGQFDITKYSPNIKTTTKIVILTFKQAEHIIDKHPEVIGYFKKIKHIIKDPDLVLKENNVLDTIWLVKEFDNNIKVTIKLNTVDCGIDGYKNSVIQMQFLDDERIQKYLKNKRVTKLFAKEKVM